MGLDMNFPLDIARTVVRPCNGCTNCIRTAGWTGSSRSWSPLAEH